MELKGKLIIFDGPDGAGKTTQLERAAMYLKDRGFSVLTTKEPGSPNISVCKEFRKLALHDESLSSYERELVFMADAAVHMRHLKEWLQQYDFVLCDRGLYSHLVYQTATLKIGKMTQSEYNTVSKLVDTFVASPDYAFIFSVNFDVAMERMKSRGSADVIEKLGPDFLKVVNEEYHKIKTGHKVIFVDANGTPDQVTNELKRALQRVIRRRRR